jgi:cold shock CspA family protein
MTVEVAFETGDDGKRSAVRIAEVLTAPSASLRVAHPDFPSQRTGTVKAWKQGFGFITPDDRGDDLFVHASSLTVQTAGVPGYLARGDQVLFRTARGEKGIEAYAIQVCGWRPTGEPLTDFADLGGSGWLQALAELAEAEDWTYRSGGPTHTFPVLESYIRHTFQRLQEMEYGICESGNLASFNTGLVTRNQEEIFALFVRNPSAERQPWRLRGFRKASDKELVSAFGAKQPPLASYFEDPSVLLYDRRCELFVNVDHVLEHIERFPPHLRNNEYMLRNLLLSAESSTKKRVYRNYKAAIPQYFRDQGKKGCVQLLLPICLEDPTRADLALVVERTPSGDAYRGSTVLTLDMAYNNARLLARPDTEWL